MKGKLLVLLCILFIQRDVTGNSISDKFFEKYCKTEDNKDSVICNNLKFSEEEINEINTKEFVISNALRVTFENASIGCLNTNFFAKFPNAVDLYIKYSTFNMSCEFEDLPLKAPLALDNLKFYYTRIYGNKDSRALHALNKLERFDMQLPKATGWMEYCFLDGKFFGKKDLLRYISIPLEELDEELKEDFLHSDVFDNCPSLYKLTYNFGKQINITKALLKNNKKVTSLDLSRNKIENIEPGSFPESVLELYLSGNSLTQCDNIFQNMTKVGYINLYGNSISNISTSAFDDLESLEILDLAKNDIKVFTKEHIKGLKSLKTLFIYDNKDLMFDKEIATNIPNFKTQI